MKRIVTIQDISCVGKCSLTTALPILSAMGMETAVLPTAVLSNHTAFSSFTFHDLTDEIPKILEVWKQQKFQFEAVYSGYLGSIRQIELVRKLQKEFTEPSALLFVDPAMADGGSLYKGFTGEFAAAMQKLCSHADVIAPNLTEACIMTGTPYREGGDELYCRDIVKRLADQGAKNVILTGFSYGRGEIGALTYERDKDEFRAYVNEKLPVVFHGTGDIFASVTLGGLMNGFSLGNAVRLAVDYTLACVRATMADEHHNWYGVNFEEALPYLIDRLRSLKGKAENVQKREGSQNKRDADSRPAENSVHTHVV